jgi:DNA-binding XRE family transcriptional regulator
MSQEDRIHKLGVRSLEIRKEIGFLKALPIEIRKEAAALVASGVSVNVMAKTLGVNRNTMIDWSQKHKPSIESANEITSGFNEVRVVDEKPSFEVRLSATVQGVRVELIGRDFAHLQRLLRKLGV